jgi:hypothetical protein
MSTPPTLWVLLLPPTTQFIVVIGSSEVDTIFKQVQVDSTFEFMVRATVTVSNLLTVLTVDSGITEAVSDPDLKPKIKSLGQQGRDKGCKQFLAFTEFHFPIAF